MSKKKILKEFNDEFGNIDKAVKDEAYWDITKTIKQFISKALDTIEKETKEKMAKTMIRDFRQRLKASRNIVKNESGNEVIAGTRITLKEINSWINETLDS